MVQELVHHGIDIVFSTVKKDYVLVRNRVLIIPIINIDIFLEGEESLWDEIQEISSSIGVVIILYVLQDFGHEVTGRGRKLDM